jgi:hypothetical protein
METFGGRQRIKRQNVLRYEPAADTYTRTMFDQMSVAIIAPSAKVVENTCVVSQGGALTTLLFLLYLYRQRE